MTVDLTTKHRVHFVGIGGIGMSALARHLIANGHAVSGSDQSPGEQGEALRTLGASIHCGHAAENVDGAELLVVTSAVRQDNPELVAALAHGIPVVKRAELLGAIVNPLRSIAVAGTHGKTTTSALIAHILVEAGLDPTVLIGGISLALHSNARLGRSDLAVTEADEYDRSFLYLQPSIGVITNVEPEHLDIYGTEAGVRAAFIEFAAGVRDLLVVCADDSAALGVAREGRIPFLTYGLEQGEWRATDICEAGSRTRFTARRGDERVEISTPLIGRHNVSNALAAVAVGSRLGVPAGRIASAIDSFSGVARRLEAVGEAGGVLVMDDYAHHPTEIRTVLAGLRARTGRPVRVVFQPHTYTRTRDFLSDFAGAFDDAAHVYLLDIYAAREKDTLGISGSDVARELALRHPSSTYIPDADAVVEQVAADAQPGDVIVSMGAGDVYLLAPRILGALQ